MNNINYLIIDTEITIWNKGSPFDPRNFCVALGIRTSNNTYMQYKMKFNVKFSPESNNTLVFFNAKFDLHWLRRLNIDFNGSPIWDCQLAEFILSNQTNKFPSLDETCKNYNLGEKIDVIKEKYWDNEISTEDIPKEELLEYLERDLELTEKLYLLQLEQFKLHPKKYELFKLQCEDLLLLEEMEWNGLFIDRQKLEEKLKQISKELLRLEHDILNYARYPDTINLQSGYHISALLYGGIITTSKKIPIGVFKTGKRIGEARFSVIETVWNFPRLIEPINKTELKKEGYWSTDEKVLRKLKPRKEVKGLISMLLEYAKLEKLKNTYFQGLLNKMKENNWEYDNILHGNLNQCAVVTGRLSSSNPNLQNMPEDIDEFLITRWNDE